MEMKFFKKKKKFIKGGLRIKPDLYWRYILCITFTLIFISCVFSLYLFKKVNVGLISSTSDMEGQEIIEKERINEVLKFFEERKNKSIEILNSSSSIIDPSL